MTKKNEFAKWANWQVLSEWQNNADLDEATRARLYAELVERRLIVEAD